MADRTPTGMMHWLAAVAGGLFLATLPYWRYVPFGTITPHMDHESRHGGQLGMVGDHHIEVVRRAGRVEVFVSDARRRPLRPDRVSVVFDRRAEVPLEWTNHRFAGRDRIDTREIEARVSLSGATELALSFDFASN